MTKPIDKAQWSTKFVVGLCITVLCFATGRAFAQPTYNEIEFVIGTGGDDLRGDSSATATLQAPNGSALQVVTLKAQNQAGWSNNTTHTITAALNPPRTASAIGRIVVTLTSHNGFAESDDNWNVQSVVVTLSNRGAGPIQFLSSSGNPLARLTGSAGSTTLTPPPAAAPGTFNQIRFTIGTGDDDLRGDSSVTATLQAANGSTLQVISLKAQNEGGWANNTTHTVTATLNPPRAPAAIAHVVITLTSHNGFAETDDNWNVQSVDIALITNGAGGKDLMNLTGVPLARLTGSAPSVRLPEAASGPAGTFNTMQFVIGTGGDDLRGDSTAMASLQSPNGTQLQTVTLKSQSDPGWGSNSQHTVSVALNPPRTPCAIGHVAITLTSHNGFAETGDNWNVQSVVVRLSNNGVGNSPLVSSSGNPVARLTGTFPTMVIDSLNCVPNALGPQPGTGRLRGFVDLHTHPLASLGFGGKLLYGGVDIGSLLPADPDCNKDVAANSMEQALGHDGSTHGQPGIGGPFSSGGVGLQNPCGDFLRDQIIQSVQKTYAQIGDDAIGAPDFRDWPVWNDITHQHMWVDWIRRSYEGGLRVMVALAVNNKTLGDATAGPGDFPTDDKWAADKEIAETKAFIARHGDFMEVAESSADLERIVRENKLAVVLGVEIDDIGDFNKVKPLTNAEITAEIDRLFAEGVRYVFPIHLLDNAFGGTATYQDLMNYSNFRENGEWWDIACVDPSVNYMFKAQGFDLFTFAGEAIKLGVDFAASTPPGYPNCGQTNKKGLTPAGEFAIKEMMRHGMLIDIDHMSQLSQRGTIAIAQKVGTGYPLNSGHSGLRGFFPQGVKRSADDETERSMNTELYGEIGKLHGMPGIGSANLTAYQWVQMYQQVVAAMGNGVVAGFGTDTDGLAPAMPHRVGSEVAYSDSFPRSSLGTKWWNYNTDGVAHYGMLPDFLKDARTAPGGAALIDNNLMFGADYFLQTWKQCEAEQTHVQ